MEGFVSIGQRLQELVRHVYVAWEPSKTSSSKRHASNPHLSAQPHRIPRKSPPKPAQASNAWLPRDITLMAYSISDYPTTTPISGTTSRQMLSYHLGSSASAPVQHVACCVYRFLRRALVMWPVGQAHDHLDSVIDVWLGVLFPWTLVDHHAKCVPLSFQQTDWFVAHLFLFAGMVCTVPETQKPCTLKGRGGPKSRFLMRTAA